jgi:hypothetical protein
MWQLANAGLNAGKVDEGSFNFLLAVINGAKPTDQIEAMLTAQMAVVHVAIMSFARRLTNADIYPDLVTAENALNKLARTFTTQMEALKRYRARSEHKLAPPNIPVAENGEAIAENASEARRENAENAPVKPAASPPAAGSDTNVVAMPVSDRDRQCELVGGGRKATK